jgi:hypothetical protein
VKNEEAQSPGTVSRQPKHRIARQKPPIVREVPSLTRSRCDRYDATVRRFAAILLLALFSVSLIEPGLMADVSKLPACCRRGGQHHCTMADTSSGGVWSRVSVRYSPRPVRLRRSPKLP